MSAAAVNRRLVGGRRRARPDAHLWLVVLVGGHAARHADLECARRSGSRHKFSHCDSIACRCAYPSVAGEATMLPIANWT
jgi:hypothetical protein